MKNDNSQYLYLLYILLLLIASRLLILVSGYYASAPSGSSHPFSLEEILCQWDCGWYMDLSQHGYDASPSKHAQGNAANWAFFPLFPLLVNMAYKVSGVDHFIAAIILNNAFLFVLMVLLYQHVKDEYSEHLAWNVLLIFSFFPYSVYFSVPYTETIYMLLMTLAFTLLYKKKWVMAGLSIALMSSTRSLGVMMVFPMLYMMVKHHGYRNIVRLNNETSPMYLGLMLAPLGLFIFMYYLYIHTGDALAFKHIQIAWGRELEDPVSRLVNALAGDVMRYKFYAAVVTSFAFLACYYLYRIGRTPEAIFCVISILIPLSTGFTSLPRYITALFPIYVVLAILMSRSVWLRYGLLGASMIACAYLSAAWTNREYFMA